MLSLGLPSAERAVDDDFSQSGLENGEFLIVEPLDEQFRHTVKMDRRSFGHTCDTGVGQGDNHAAPVLSGVRPTYETLIIQPRDAAGQPRAREERAGGELRHPQLAAGAGQLSQDVEVGEGQAGVLLEIGIELADERGLRLQQSTPRLLSAPARQRLLGKPTEESSYITRW